ncbi:MAG TPA: CBS domain-containing protein [Acidimicrobiales bacterium]|nr:CBS domain-containing protein [Acidimicrobiales bacterium]
MAEQTSIGSMMNSTVVAIDRDASLRSAARSLNEAAVGTVVIMDGRRVSGILSERDVVRALAAGADPDSSAVAAAMSSSPRYATPRDEVRTAMDIMLAAGIRHLPVLDEGELVGIVSMRDLARHLGR